MVVPRSSGQGAKRPMPVAHFFCLSGTLACKKRPVVKTPVRRAPLLLTILTVAACAAGGAEALPPTQPPPPPVVQPPPRKHTPEVATRVDNVTDDYFGHAVTDPYRWLEDSDSAEVKAWTDEQNRVTRARLDAIPGRDKLAQRIRELLEVGTMGAPEVTAVRKVAPGAGKRRYFHTRREGAQNQPVLYVREGARGEDRVLIDPATFSADATSALDWWAPSLDGSLVAWGKSDKGSEESTLSVRDVTKGTDLGDRIPFTRNCSVVWLPRGDAFYYTRYPEPGSVPPGDEKYNRRVYFHRLGDDYKKDKLVFGEGREKTDYPGLDLSPDGRWLVVTVQKGWERNEVYLRDLSLGDKAAWVPVAAGLDALFEAVPRSDALYLLTNLRAPRYRLMKVDYKTPAEDAWKELVPEGPDVMSKVEIIGKTIFATLLHDAASVVRRFTLAGEPRGQVVLPAIGTARVAGAWDGDEAFVSFTSYVVPPLIMRIDLKTPPAAGGAGGGSGGGAGAGAGDVPAGEVWDKLAAGTLAGGAGSSLLTSVSVKRLYATSRDGTRVPMFVVEKEGTVHDGSAKTVLWGYGGFNVNQTPAFSARALLTVEQGGVWVTAILRGGGELGESWHRAGMLANKQNVFDDAIACAEMLISERVTSSDRLALMGGSNGGLLVAAVVTQRPDLFRVGMSLVPLTDMLRYERFRIAKLWTPEYGSASNAEQWPFLYAYSPYHHVKDGAAYPAMLFTTAESDSRVDPMHARKMAARMQVAQGAARPILLRVETKAGHGQGKPVSKLVEELTDEFSFLFSQLGGPA